VLILICKICYRSANPFGTGRRNFFTSTSKFELRGHQLHVSRKLSDDTDQVGHVSLFPTFDLPCCTKFAAFNAQEWLLDS